MNKEDYITLYLCNNNDSLCPVRAQCIPKPSIGCSHTSHEAAAAFGLCEDPWCHPDRFIRIVTDDGKTQFWERIPPTRLYQHYNGNFFKPENETHKLTQSNPKEKITINEL